MDTPHRLGNHLLFMDDRYYPSKGMESLVARGSFEDCYNTGLLRANDFTYTWAQIVNLNTLEIVLEGDSDDDLVFAWEEGGNDD